MTEGQGPRRRTGTAQAGLTAYQSAAWRAPGTTRFDSRPANDFRARAETVTSLKPAPRRTEIDRLPRWVGLAVGAVLAALLGAVIGGMMAL